ncbi:hypothetical protein ACUXSM_005581 [Burkholderia sp. 132550021-2]
MIGSILIRVALVAVATGAASTSSPANRPFSDA